MFGQGRNPGYVPQLHEALKVTQGEPFEGNGITVKFVTLQNSKEDKRLTAHVHVNVWSSAGFQMEDVLEIAGLTESQCQFVGNTCFAKVIPEDSDIQAFSNAISNACHTMQRAEKELQQCSILVDRPSGAGRGYPGASGDGHTSPSADRMKESEDDNFSFVLTGLKGGRDHGWGYHYRAKQLPLSPEVQAAFRFLGLQDFKSCPEFDFEPCYWRFISYQRHGDTPFDSNAHFANQGFDAHAEHFSPGLELLLDTHKLLQPFGMSFLKVQTPKPAVPPAPAPTPEPKRTAALDEDFDIAISFAGPQRPLAEELAKRLHDASLKVFYDDYYPAQLWGTDLPVKLDNIYRKQSKFCVMFISKEYVERVWTNHERKSAQARALHEKDAYILPIKVEDVELPGMPDSIGYVSIEKYSIEQIAEMCVQKVKEASYANRHEH
jgi:hypothetical protein